jgi:tRNA A37 N6-isopentenylltransferase MiaA
MKSKLRLRLVMDRTTTLEEIKKNTRRYAKRQATWFKHYQDALLVSGGSSVEDVLRKFT